MDTNAINKLLTLYENYVLTAAECRKAGKDSQADKYGKRATETAEMARIMRELGSAK